MKKASRGRNAANSSGGRLRLIGGQWRGRVLSFPDADGLRPTGDRQRETLFNWLQLDMPGARCLDLFAGSGALGLEALSRGAGLCTLLELNPAACSQLAANARLLNADQAEVIHTNSLDWLRQPPAAPYDIVFLDPPFAADLWQACIDALAQPGWLNADAAVYIEAPCDASFTVPGHWMLNREKRSGANSYRLYRLA
ncbi:16S rRNA (guanine(966)-N(2))-methyltransferase RsmD [Simiduia agarivorans]|uniref:Ribosomal RNA small subunit methyltransferase D n=1 Tax=Simiduia agarivorans (strain DSM 21679 / JCM 13881 / BCRC 17597 / SA1) TaxID=1117647 RepID=K4L0Q8_SIMAS|nr:16S rRNA (guanine(966)-N(2))-methyltransferase RsmD [Simiduia agarivorans]AFU99727.1 putative methyltransferase [Simiduia agarivorans SA1 = DSM 21679]